MSRPEGSPGSRRRRRRTPHRPKSSQEPQGCRQHITTPSNARRLPSAHHEEGTRARPGHPATTCSGGTLIVAAASTGQLWRQKRRRDDKQWKRNNSRIIPYATANLARHSTSQSFGGSFPGPTNARKRPLRGPPLPSSPGPIVWWPRAPEGEKRGRDRGGVPISRPKALWGTCLIRSACSRAQSREPNPATGCDSTATRASMAHQRRMAHRRPRERPPAGVARGTVGTFAGMSWRPRTTRVSVGGTPLL